MVRLDDFLHANRLKQVDLANYLSVTKGYISLVLNGKKTLSKENLGKLIDNPYGWNTTMLTSDQPENPVVEQPEERSIVEKLFELLAEEQKSNKILLELLKEKDQKIEALQEEIRHYREHKGETAKDAATSFAANAV